MQIRFILLAVSLAAVVRADATQGAVPDVMSGVQAASGSPLSLKQIRASKLPAVPALSSVQGKLPASNSLSSLPAVASLKNMVDTDKAQVADTVKTVKDTEYKVSHLKSSDFCQTDGEGDYGGICNGKLTGHASSDSQDGTASAFNKAGAPANFRRATEAESLNILCYDDGNSKAGFCNSNLPVAQADKNTKAPIRRRSTIMEVIKEMIPRDEHAAKSESTSIVHLCSQTKGTHLGEIYEIKGYPGLCKRLVGNNLGTDKATSGSLYGAEQGFKGGFYGASKGYEGTRNQTKYTLDHPDTIVPAVVSAAQTYGGQLTKMGKRQGSILLPCVHDEKSHGQSGFCDSLIPVAEERDIAELIRRAVVFNAHRRFARPNAVHK